MHLSVLASLVIGIAAIATLPFRLSSFFVSVRLPNVEQIRRDDKEKLSPLLLLVWVKADRQIRLNGDIFGTLDDPEPLTQKLKAVMDERLINHAYKIGMELRTDIPETDRIEKTITFWPDSSLPQAEVEALLNAIKATGVEPVIVINEQDFRRKYSFFENLGGPTPLTGKLRGDMLYSGFLNGNAKKLIRPEFPSTPKAKHVGGEVRVRIFVDKSGLVYAAKIISGPSLFRAVSLEAARQAQFEPPVFEGKSVKLTGIISYRFVAQ